MKERAPAPTCSVVAVCHGNGAGRARFHNAHNFTKVKGPCKKIPATFHPGRYDCVSDLIRSLGLAAAQGSRADPEHVTSMGAPPFWLQSGGSDASSVSVCTGESVFSSAVTSPAQRRTDTGIAHLSKSGGVMDEFAPFPLFALSLC
jgi:hypothetical protein